MSHASEGLTPATGRAGVFAQLVDLSTVPVEVRRFHERAGRFHGRATVTTKPWARWFGLPGRSGEFDIAVDGWRDDAGEIWTRHFPPRPMQ